MTAEAQAFEIECRDTLREELPAPCRSVGRIIEAVDLEGSYPETKVLVTWHWTRRPDKTLVADWAIWDGDIGPANVEVLTRDAEAVGGFVGLIVATFATPVYGDLGSGAGIRWEEDCLSAVRRALSVLLFRLEAQNMALGNVQLIGAYPDTTLEIVIRGPAPEDSTTTVFPLWDGTFAKTAEGPKAPVSDVVDAVGRAVLPTVWMTREGI